MIDYSGKSNDELNVEVAKKKGWEWLKYNSLGDECWHRPIEDKLFMPLEIPNWSTSMDACMELVEEMRDSLVDISPASLTETSWRIEIDEEPYGIFADTLPRAVVIAWLTWEEEK